MNNSCRSCGLAEAIEGEAYCPTCCAAEGARLQELEEALVSSGVLDGIPMKTISVWPFHLAPQELQNFSNSGGDEDWLVFIPARLVPQVLAYGTPMWIENMDAMRSISQFTLLDGSVIFIAAHS